MSNIKKGDTVKIISGKDRGKSGKIVAIFPKERKVTIQGLNVYKKHVRPKRQGEKGEIVQVERPVFLSNVLLVCHRCGKATRTGHRFQGEKKVRYCRKCKADIS